MEKYELMELESIKKLMILLLIKSGVSADVIAKTLGIHPSRISQMFPIKKIKR
jgi:IS30 family transposase